MAMQHAKVVKDESHKHLTTSIGHGAHSRPTNRHKRRGWKRYRGQGK